MKTGIIKRILSLLLALTLALSFVACAARPKLEHNDWAPEVKTAVNDMIKEYRNKGKYVVTDFDNTCSIFDIEETMMKYMYDYMAFEIKPEDMSTLLGSDIGDLNEDRSYCGIITGSYADIIEDISSSYSYLWDNYGPFTYKGVSDETKAKMCNDGQWMKFAVKLISFYEVITECESTAVSYPWVTKWFTGMTEEELYDLAYRSCSFHKDLESYYVTVTIPDDVPTLSGGGSYTWSQGLSVSENVKELWKCLTANGIDVWVCSASSTAVIKAAIDIFGIHDYCKGVLAMTSKFDENGRMTPEFDLENGCGYYAGENGTWPRMETPINTQTQLEGKVTATERALLPVYNNEGPIAGFMDSSGDFNFCTEFDSLSLVICYNRGNRKVTDGGGLIAEIAMYEKDTLKYDYKKARKAGDTLYLLQGREENGMRSLRNSNKTICLGETEEVLFANEDNYAQLQYIIDNKMTVADAINTFAIKTSAEDSVLGFKYGFLDTYYGYHSK